MATLGLDEDELKSVEHMVARLAQLSSSIQSLKKDILASNPLPHPYVCLCDTLMQPVLTPQASQERELKWI